MCYFVYFSVKRRLNGCSSSSSTLIIVSVLLILFIYSFNENEFEKFCLIKITYEAASVPVVLCLNLIIIIVEKKLLQFTYVVVSNAGLQFMW